MISYIYIYQLSDQTDLQRSCILELLSTVDPPEPVDLDTSDTDNRDKNANTDIGGTDTNKKKYNATLLLALLALLCEFASLFSGSQDEVVRFLYRLTNILKNCSGAYSPFFLSVLVYSPTRILVFFVTSVNARTYHTLSNSFRCSSPPSSTFSAFPASFDRPRIIV